MSAVSNRHFGNVVHAVERTTLQAGYSLLIADTHDDPERERRVVNDLLSHRVDAMIIAISAEPRAMLDILTKRSVPTVLIDRVPEELRCGIDAVGVFNEEPNAQLVDHLADIGHARIATITSRPGLATTVERLSGYWLALDRNGLERDPDLVRVGNDATRDLTEAALADLLALPQPPTAIVMGNNQVTIATMTALRSRGMVVPADMALVAFDDFPWADLVHPRLTALTQPVDELGSQAVSMILKRLRDPDLPPRHKGLDPALKHREPCGARPTK